MRQTPVTVDLTPRVMTGGFTTTHPKSVFADRRDPQPTLPRSLKCRNDGTIHPQLPTTRQTNRRPVHTRSVWQDPEAIDAAVTQQPNAIA